MRRLFRSRSSNAFFSLRMSSSAFDVSRLTTIVSGSLSGNGRRRGREESLSRDVANGLREPCVSRSDRLLPFVLPAVGLSSQCLPRVRRRHRAGWIGG
jgi:hypothetical protein